MILSTWCYEYLVFLKLGGICNKCHSYKERSDEIPNGKLNLKIIITPKKLCFL
jgi:hypothetical protein